MNNKFSVLPTSDLKQLERLSVKGVTSLINFPRAFEDNEENKPTFPSIENLTLEYQTHCCWYKDYYLHQPGNIIFHDNNVLVGCSPQPNAFHPCYDIIL